MGEQVREALERAYDSLESGSNAVEPEASPVKPADSGQTVEKSGSAAPIEVAPAKPSKAPTPGQAAKAAREAAAPPKPQPKPATPKPAAQDAAKPEAEPLAAQPTAPKTRAPNAWKPELREKWAALPEEVRAQITERESHIQSELTQSASARKLAGDFVNTVRPYEQLIRASGATPIQAVRSLMNTAAVLQVGTAQQKAQTVVDIIKNYGLDIPMIDSLLTGKIKADSAPETQLANMLEQKMRPFQQMMQQMQQQTQQSQQELQEQSASEVEQFQNSEQAEFLEDVRADMADLLELAAKRGKKLTLQDAYDQACQLNPEIQRIRTQRAEAERITNNPRNPRAAAASLPAGTPPSVGGTGKPGKGSSVRDALGAAWDTLSNA